MKNLVLLLVTPFVVALLAGCEESTQIVASRAAGQALAEVVKDTRAQVVRESEPLATAPCKE